MIVLAGDIGGTNSRFALYETQIFANGDKRLVAPIFERTYPSAGHPSLDEIAELFLGTAASETGGRVGRGVERIPRRRATRPGLRALRAGSRDRWCGHRRGVRSKCT